MNQSTQIERAEAFRKMHHAGRLLILPNAWDAVTAKLYEQEGFGAIGTTSAGIASALGYPDGEVIPLEENLAVCRRIAERVAVPVSFDIEAGYAACVAGLKETIGKVLQAGAAGINIEDRIMPGCGGGHSSTLAGVDTQCERIAAIREAANTAGVPLVINARTDVILATGAAREEQLAEAVARGNAYHAVGADCVFVPDTDVLGEAQIGYLARELHAPLNLIAGGRTPSVQRLEELGVARLSFGPRAMRVTLQLLRDMAGEWRASGTYTRLTSQPSPSYDEVNRWFEGCVPGRG